MTTTKNPVRRFILKDENWKQGENIDRTLIFIVLNLIYPTTQCELSKICIFAMQTHIKMKKSFYRSDYLFSKGSFLTGMGSILSIFAPFYTFNGSRSEKQADATALESDFGVIGQDIYSVLRTYKF